MTRSLLCAALALLSIGATAQVTEPAKQPQGYAFVDVSVIPMRKEGVLKRQTVIVKGDRIVEIGPTDAVEIDPGLAVIEGKGRYLLPGLVDMHVHVWDERELPLYVANGVTLVRNMWGEKTTLAMRERIMAGELVGPTIVTAGSLIDGEPRIWGSSARAVTPAEGEQLVTEQKAAGFDFIKVYGNLRLDVFDAIAAAAKARDVPFAGHVPDAVPLSHALRSGMASIEHTTGYMRATLTDGVSMGDNSRAPETLALAKRLAAGELSYDQVFDADKLQAVVEQTRDANVWNAPTLLVLKTGALTRAEVKAAMARDAMRYVSASTQMGWYRARRSDAEQTAMKAFADRAPRERVAALHRAGAGILAGTDAPNPQVVHGFAIHQELALLQQAGLTPFEVLASATTNPAAYFGTPDVFGSVVEGARADLLLLEANPLNNLDHLQRRTGVMLRGRWFPEAELQAMLRQAAAHHRIVPDWFAKIASLPLAGGDGVQSRAQFISTFADKPIAADRLAVVAAPGGGRSIIAQRTAAGRNAGERAYRLDLDANGALVRHTFDERYQFGRRGSLERDGAHYRLSVADLDPQTITVAAGELVLTGTIADGFILGDRLLDMAVGQTRTLTVWTIVAPRGGLKLQRETWLVARRAVAAKSEAQDAVRFDIQISSEGPAEATTLWFDRNGSPLRLEESDGLFQQKRVESPGKVSPVESNT